ncbi:MAG: hypothetical protein NVS4B8_16610 [Herpetosiphon sp.]
MKEAPRHVDQVRIVIIDDQHDLAEMLSNFLTDEGYAVTVCNTGRDALETIQTTNPAAVVLDIMLPETDGFEILRQLRTSPGGKRMPVILMSAAWRSGEKQREIGTTLDVAPTLVLPKPFELHDLEQCLRQLGVSPVPA